MFFCRSFVRLLLFQLQPRGLFSDFFSFSNFFPGDETYRRCRNTFPSSTFQKFSPTRTLFGVFFSHFFLFRMCACVLVCIVCGMCSLTIDCVLLLQNVFSCIVCVYRVCVCVCACSYVCVCVRACVDVCMGECQCVCKPSLLNPKP